MKKPEIKVPKALDAIAEVVLAYRPKPKTPSSKKRNQRAAKMMKVKSE
jgi:hypothetical protein